MQKWQKRKYFLAVILLFIFSLSGAPHTFGKTVAGSSCKKIGTTQSVLGKRYICSSLKSKLVWVPQIALKPAPLSGPSWTQIATEKAFADAKTAAELRSKMEAEARVAEQLRVKIQADALAAEELRLKTEIAVKAAKADAEKPKIQGLTIGNLLWSDEFLGTSGSAVNSRWWSARTCHRVPSMGGGACFNDEVQFYTADNVELDGSAIGAAVIRTNRPSSSASLGACLTARCQFASGRFDTHGKLSFQYGFIEARIKMPSGSGNHPAFWMLGENINEVGWPSSGEIDITEIKSDKPFITTAAINFSTYFSPFSCCRNHNFIVASLDVGADVSVDFHTYAVAWLPNSISFYVDGKIISTSTPQTLGGHWSFNERFFLIFNNAVNANFSGSWENLQSSTMTIDWVRSYELNSQGQVFIK